MVAERFVRFKTRIEKFQFSIKSDNAGISRINNVTKHCRRKPKVFKIKINCFIIYGL